jgi:uncharacterized protein (DUF433 family)
MKDEEPSIPIDQLIKRITINPQICFGKPTIRNKRYPVIKCAGAIIGRNDY